MPSPLNPAWTFMMRVVSSTRKTPANPSPNGTTAELKMLFDRSIWSRLMMGLRLDLHSTALEPAGRSSQGMFGSASAGASPVGASPKAGRAWSLAESIRTLSFDSGCGYLRGVPRGRQGRRLEPPPAAQGRAHATSRGCRVQATRSGRAFGSPRVRVAGLSRAGLLPAAASCGNGNARSVLLYATRNGRFLPTGSVDSVVGHGL